MAKKLDYSNQNVYEAPWGAVVGDKMKNGPNISIHEVRIQDEGNRPMFASIFAQGPLLEELLKAAYEVKAKDEEG